jgi:hypothetical protein
MAMAKELRLIDFVAYKLYEEDCFAEGRAAVKWLCVNDEIRASYLARAESEYSEWHTSERLSENVREGIGK